MSAPCSSLTGTGPMWSAKHQAPTVRRGRRGSTRRTGSSPTNVWRPGSSDTWRAAGLAGSGDAAASSVVTGPLMDLLLIPAGGTAPEGNP